VSTLAVIASEAKQSRSKRIMIAALATGLLRPRGPRNAVVATQPLTLGTYS
jgi:hypothetical protein